MSEVLPTFVASYEATRQSSSVPRTQKMNRIDVRSPIDLRDSLCGDAAVVECIAHSGNGMNLVSEVNPTFGTLYGATLRVSSASRTRERE